MDINVLILGKSGAGKSTLLNYLWGERVADTDIGRPVTPKAKDGEIGLYKHDPINLNGHSLVVSDSWGLEADRASEWLNTVMPELEKHESSPDASDWFHTVIYCVGASGARLEPFETDEVVSRLQKAGHTVVFALTKADRASPEERNGLRKAIEEGCPGNGGIIEIESLEVERRNGEKTKPRGKSELIKVITDGLSKKLRRKLANRYMEECQRACNRWKSRALDCYDREAGFFTPTSVTLNRVAQEAESDFKSMMRALDEWYRKTLFQLHDFQKAFGEAMEFSVSGVNARDNTYFSGGSIEWDWSDYLTRAVMQLIPVVNIAYLFGATEMHRDILSKKLDSTVNGVLAKAKSIAAEIVQGI